jgi:hypothetical protein
VDIRLANVPGQLLKPGFRCLLRSDIFDKVFLDPFDLKDKAYGDHNTKPQRVSVVAVYRLLLTPIVSLISTSRPFFASGLAVLLL